MFLEKNFDAQVDEWIRITQIPAPSRFEAARAGYVAEQLRSEGLAVEIDEIGNVVGRRPGTGSGPTLVFAAHMDTVHPQDTDVTVRRDGGVLRGPGVHDNSASVANMLAVIRAMNHAGIRTRGNLIVVGTVQEELGLRGMSHFLDSNPNLTNMLIALDGGIGSVPYGALGIYWARFTFRAAGAHTLASRGRPHPARAVADAIQSIYTIEIPEGEGGAIYNVGMLSGGKVFNALPEECSFTIDLRSVNPQLLKSLKDEIHRRVASVAETHGVDWHVDVANEREAGGTEEMLGERRAHPIVQTAVDVYRYLGIDSPARATGSTDANAGVVRGIPSIAMGRSRGGAQHSLDEWADVASALPATKAVLLVALSLAGVEPESR
jgi:tripeptide aminopeptidase